MLMSELEHAESKSQDFSESTYRSAIQYICVDDNAESVGDQQLELALELIFT